MSNGRPFSDFFTGCRFQESAFLSKEDCEAVEAAVNDSARHIRITAEVPGFTTIITDADAQVFDHADDIGIYSFNMAAGHYLAKPDEKSIGGYRLFTYLQLSAGQSIDGLLKTAHTKGEMTEDGLLQYAFKPSEAPTSLKVEVNEIRATTGRAIRISDLLAGLTYKDLMDAGNEMGARDVLLAFYAKVEKAEPELPKQDEINPTKHVQGVSKVTDKASEMVADGEPFRIDMSGENEPPVYTTLSLTYESDDIKTSKPITPYDESVQNAVATLWAAGVKAGTQGQITITPTQVWRVMTGATGKTRPGEKSLENVISSMDKQRRVFVTIDWTAELRGKTSKRDDEVITIDKCKHEAYMLNADKMDITTTRGTRAIGYVIHSEPIFYLHDKTTNQITSYPQSLLAATAKVVSSTPVNLTMRDYAIRRIARMKNGNSKTSHKIAYDTWFERIGRKDASRKDRGRMMETARKILDAIMGEGFIDGWREYGKGGSSHRIEGVEISVRGTKSNKR